MRRGVCWLALLCACGSAARDADGEVPDAATSNAPRRAPSCEPAPERCDALGDERPGRLSEHAAAYDRERLELVVFGGTPTVPEACAIGGAVRFVDETWIYDDACGDWTRVSGEAPSATGRHMAAAGDGQVWVFGGRFRAETASSGSYELYDDLFRFDVTARAWHSVEVMGERPAPRVNGALVWDAARAKLWLFGGNTSADGARYEAQGDLWSFDPGEGRWTEQAVAGDAPAPRLFHAGLYDEKRDALVVYGGADETAFSDTARYFGDLWALDLAAMRWNELHPGRNSAPQGRFSAGLVHDSERDAYVLFGGHDDGMLGNRNDTWRFDPEGARWTLVSTGDTYANPARDFCDFPPDFTNIDTKAPERRNSHTLAWSDACGHALVFGGKTDCGAIDDVWTLAGDDWTEALPASEGEACARWREDPETCADMCF